jgi:hypothetical protein
MQHSLPVITRSTPWCDNAQVELVEHGVTGYVCNSHAGAAEGLLRLAADPIRRRLFGAASVERIDLLSNINHETDLLEEIIRQLVLGEPLREITQRNHQLLQFQPTFAARERRVLESELPGLKIAHWRGISYGAYRTLRSQIGQLKAVFKPRS